MFSAKPLYPLVNPVSQPVEPKFTSYIGLLDISFQYSVLPLPLVAQFTVIAAVLIPLNLGTDIVG